MDTFNAIPIFVAVARNQSFSGAARELGLSKSAVSKRITQLEDRLGARLIQRSTRKLSLTELGERFFEHAQFATVSARNAVDAVSELQGEPVGQLKIVVPMSFGMLHIAPLIPEFLKRYPKTEIDLVMDDKPVNLIAEGYDLAIRTGDLPESNLIARTLAPLHSVVCASPDYLAKHPIERPEELEQHNCLTFSYSSNADHWEFFESTESPTQPISVRVDGNYQVNNSEALKQAVIQGLGIGRLPTFIVGDALRSGELVQLFSQYEMPSKRVHAVFPERHYMPAKVRSFLDYVIEQFGDGKPYWDQF